MNNYFATLAARMEPTAEERGTTLQPQQDIALRFGPQFPMGGTTGGGATVNEDLYADRPIYRPSPPIAGQGSETVRVIHSNTTVFPADRMGYMARHTDRIVAPAAIIAGTLSPATKVTDDAGGNSFSSKESIHPGLDGQGRNPETGRVEVDRKELRPVAERLLPTPAVTVQTEDDKRKLVSTEIPAVRRERRSPGAVENSERLVPIPVRLRPPEPPAAEKMIAKATKPAPSLVIGKITVEVVKPVKAPVKVVQRSRPASSAINTGSFNKQNFGLGQL